MELTINDIREQLKIHCPGEAFHADNKTHAELIANRFMDCTAILLGEIERIEKQWISVETALPEKADEFLTYDKDKDYAVGYFQDGNWSDPYGTIRLHPTHWQPLPPPPE